MVVSIQARKALALLGHRPFHYFHHHPEPRLKCGAHVSMDLMMRKFKFMRLQQTGNDNPCLGLTKRRADTDTRSTAKRDVAHGRCFISVCKTLRAEFFRVLPYSRVALREIEADRHRKGTPVSFRAFSS